MKAPEIIIKQETFRLDFSLMAFRELGKKWELKSISEVMARVSELDNGTDDLSFEMFDRFSEIITTFVNAAEDNPREILEKEILRMPMPELMKLFQSFSVVMVDSVQTENAVNPDDQGKKAAVKSSRSKKN